MVLSLTPAVCSELELAEGLAVLQPHSPCPVCPWHLSWAWPAPGTRSISLEGHISPGHIDCFHFFPQTAESCPCRNLSSAQMLGHRPVWKGTEAASRSWQQRAENGSLRGLGTGLAGTGPEAALEPSRGVCWARGSLQGDDPVSLQGEILDTTVLLRTCVQSAVGMLRDQKQELSRSRRRIEILLGLFSQEDELKGVCCTESLCIWGPPEQLTGGAGVLAVSRQGGSPSNVCLLHWVGCRAFLLFSGGSFSGCAGWFFPCLANYWNSCQMLCLVGYLGPS